MMRASFLHLVVLLLLLWSSPFRLTQSHLFVFAVLADARCLEAHPAPRMAANHFVNSSPEREGGEV